MKFDYIYRNIGVIDAVEALIRSTQGFKVAIYFTNNNPKEDEFVYSRMLPKKLDEFFKLKEQIKLINLLRSIAPHTIIPQRVLSLRKSKSISKSLVSSYNLVYGDAEDQRIFFYNLKSVGAYETLYTEECQYGILGLEYRFNLSRFIIECLKEAEKLGAIIIPSQEDPAYNETNERSFNNLSREDLFFGENCLEGLTNVVRFSDKENDILIIPSGDKLKISSIGTGEISSHFSKIFKSDISSTRRNCSSGIVDDLLTEIKTQFSESELLNVVTNISAHNPNTLRTPSTQALTNLCDIKYDMYKETGITREKTKKLYFTFGENVDDIAEIVYSLINSKKYIGNRLLLWDDAVDIYRKQNEWK